jgi:hypothetical protein
MARQGRRELANDRAATTKDRAKGSAKAIILAIFFASSALPVVLSIIAPFTRIYQLSSANGVEMMTDKPAVDQAYALGIFLYLREDGRLYQQPPGKAFDPGPQSRPSALGQLLSRDMPGTHED